jgi:hypothetical protein
MLLAVNDHSSIKQKIPAIGNINACAFSEIKDRIILLLLIGARPNTFLLITAVIFVLLHALPIYGQRITTY